MKKGLAAKRKHHCTERAQERYGVKMRTDDINAIGNIIRAGRGTAGTKLSTGKSLWVVHYNGQDMAVIYSTRAHCAKTILPMDDRRVRELLAEAGVTIPSRLRAGPAVA